MADLRQRLRLVLVSPGDRAPDDTLRLVEESVAGGVTAVLLRERQLDESGRLALYGRLVQRLRPAGTLVLVSGEPRLAARVEAEGVHLGFGHPTVGRARELAPGLLVGRSAHWPLEAQDEAADYATLSPVRATPASHPRPLLTPEQIADACARLGPVVALGGLDAAAIGDLPPGPVGVAVVRALSLAPDPRGAAALLRSAADTRVEFGGGAGGTP